MNIWVYSQKVSGEGVVQMLRPVRTPGRAVDLKCVSLAGRNKREVVEAVVGDRFVKCLCKQDAVVVFNFPLSKGDGSGFVIVVRVAFCQDQECNGFYAMNIPPHCNVTLWLGELQAMVLR